MQGMAAVRAHWKQEQIRKSAAQVWDIINQTTFPHMRCTLPIIKQILLWHDTASNFINGTKVIFCKKSLGAGVYDVYMEIAK